MRYTLLVLLFICIIPKINAQEPLKHEKRIYRAPNGKLYINKALPLYLRISTSPDKNASSHLLESESTKQYANPMYLDTEGYNTIRSPSAVDTVTKKPVYPEQDIIFEIYADSYTPVTNINYGDAPKKYINRKLYIGKDLNITLKSRDAMSGVEDIYYSVDKETFKKYANPITLSSEKEYTFAYYAVDNTGNAEKVKTKTFTLDVTSPVSSHTVNGDQKENILSKRSTISLDAKDEGSGVHMIYYKIDNGRKQVYRGKIHLSYLSEGEHTLTYYAIDEVKNQEVEKKYVFFLDSTPPIVVEEVLGDQFYINGKAYSSGRTKLKVTAVDNKAGVKAIYYTIDGSEKQLYDKPFYLPTKSGNVTIKTYAVDNVGNETGTSAVESSKVHATYIDLTGPELDYAFVGKTYKMRDTVYVGKNTRIRLKGSDTESGFKKITYAINEDSTTTYNSPFYIAKEGFQDISYTGYDNVNNSNIGHMFFVADLTGPDIIPTFSMNPFSIKKEGENEMGVYPDHLVLFVAAKDEMIGFDKMYYSINGAREKQFNGYISGFVRGADYVIKIRAVDKLGNEKEEIILFSIEK